MPLNHKLTPQNDQCQKIQKRNQTIQQLLMESFFEVDHDLKCNQNQNNFTEFTFGSEETWIKYPATQQWLIKSLQLLLFYIFSDQNAQVSKNQSSTTLQQLQNLSKLDDRQQQKKIKAIILQQLQNFQNEGQGNKILKFIEWLQNIGLYYSQEKAKMNIICSKITQKAQIHLAFKQYLHSIIPSQNSRFIMHLQRQDPITFNFQQLNTKIPIGLELSEIIEKKILKFVTKPIDNSQYCLYICPTQRLTYHDEIQKIIRIRITILNVSEKPSNTNPELEIHKSSLGLIINNSSIIDTIVDAEDDQVKKYNLINEREDMRETGQQSNASSVIIQSQCSKDSDQKPGAKLIALYDAKKDKQWTQLQCNPKSEQENNIRNKINNFKIFRTTEIKITPQKFKINRSHNIVLKPKNHCSRALKSEANEIIQPQYPITLHKRPCSSFILSNSNSYCLQTVNFFDHKKVKTPQKCFRKPKSPIIRYITQYKPKVIFTYSSPQNKV